MKSIMFSLFVVIALQGCSVFSGNSNDDHVENSPCACSFTGKPLPIAPSPQDLNEIEKELMQFSKA
jgi:hypothetical protein